jgi:hypothetical protein
VADMMMLNISYHNMIAHIVVNLHREVASPSITGQFSGATRWQFGATVPKNQ